MNFAYLYTYNLNLNNMKKLLVILIGLTILSGGNLVDGIYFYKICNSNTVIGTGRIIAQ